MKRSTLKNESRRSTPPPEGALRRVTTLVSHSLKLLLILMLTCLSALPAQAGDPSASDIKFSTSCLSDNDGLFEFSFQFYNQTDGDIGLPPRGGSYGSSLKINNVDVIEFWSFTDTNGNVGQSDKNSYWLKSKLVNNDLVAYAEVLDELTDTYKAITKLNVEEETKYTRTNVANPFAKYRVYLNRKGLALAANPNSILEVELRLVYDKNNDGKTGWGSPQTKKDTLTFIMPIMPTMSHKFSTTPGKYSLFFTSSDTKHDIVEDSCVITEIRGGGNDITTTYSASNPSGLFDIQNLPTRIEYEYIYKYNKYQSVSSIGNTYSLPRYQQANNFNATDTITNADSKRNIILTWSIPSVNANNSVIEGDEFEVQRSDNQFFNNPTTISKLTFNRNTLNYTAYDDISGKNINTTYYYRVRRTASANEWG